MPQLGDNGECADVFPSFSTCVYVCVCVYVSFKKKHVLTAVLGPALWGKEMNETLPWPLGPTDQWQQELQAFLHHPRAFLKKASFPKEQ